MHSRRLGNATRLIPTNPTNTDRLVEAGLRPRVWRKTLDWGLGIGVSIAPMRKRLVMR